MYREFAPPAALAGEVACFWAIRAEARPDAAIPNRVLPDGCMDVIFNLGDAPDGPGANRLPGYVVGAMTRPGLVAMARRIDVLGVRFRPGGARAFLPLPAAELTDRILPLADAWRAEAEELVDRLAALDDARARVALLGERLLRRRGDAARGPSLAAHASARIARTGGRVTVAALAAEAGVTTRQLERAFAAEVGLTPKQACRVARFGRALETVIRRPAVAWTELAYLCGYHDQPHLAREIRALSGLTPTELRAAYAPDVASLQDGSGAAR